MRRRRWRPGGGSWKGSGRGSSRTKRRERSTRQGQTNIAHVIHTREFAFSTLDSSVTRHPMMRRALSARLYHKAKADAAVASAGTVPEGLDPKQRKLFELRLKLNESRKAGRGRNCQSCSSTRIPALRS